MRVTKLLINLWFHFWSPVPQNWSSLFFSSSSDGLYYFLGIINTIVLFTIFNVFTAVISSAVWFYLHILPRDFDNVCYSFRLVAKLLSCNLNCLLCFLCNSILISGTSIQNNTWQHPKHPYLPGVKIFRRTCSPKTRILVSFLILVAECLKLINWTGLEFTQSLITMTSQTSRVTNLFMRELGILAYIWLL